MSRLTPLELPQLDSVARDRLEQGERIMGFMPNDALTMARVPGLPGAALQLVKAYSSLFDVSESISLRSSYLRLLYSPSSKNPFLSSSSAASSTPPPDSRTYLMPSLETP